MSKPHAEDEAELGEQEGRMTPTGKDDKSTAVLPPSEEEIGAEGYKAAGGIFQSELPGVVPPVTKSHLRAEECVRQKMAVKHAQEKLKNMERNLLYAMHDDKLITVKVRDEAGFLHEFHIEELERVKYKAHG